MFDCPTLLLLCTASARAPMTGTDPGTPSDMAVIVTGIDCDLSNTIPDADTVAAAVSLDSQVTTRPTSAVWFESRGVATSCTDAPESATMNDGLRSIDATELGARVAMCMVIDA